VTDEAVLIDQLEVLQSATARAAGEIAAREKDGSFLERTLRDALARELPRARIEQPLGLDLALWPGKLGGVDVVYVPDSGARIGVETKVWDVSDSLYDVLKLAAATQQERLRAGFCVIAGRTRDWQAPSAIRQLSTNTRGQRTEHDTAALLHADTRGWRRIWSRAAILPTAIPARLQVVAGEPFAMPRVPDHEIRLIGVAAAGDVRLALDITGAAVGE
jgi:hypothetical protein